MTEPTQRVMADQLESDYPEWVQRAVTLHDQFDGRMTLRVAQPQPQYGTVQLNSEYKDHFISVDVNAAELLAALEAVMSTPPALSAACSCGHAQSDHVHGFGPCQERDRSLPCGCAMFTPRAGGEDRG